VMGSALAMIIGLSWGFSGALYIGAGIYLGVTALFATSASWRLAESPELSSPKRGLLKQVRPQVGVETSSAGRGG
jgi:hypothetical protein